MCSGVLVFDKEKERGLKSTDDDASSVSLISVNHRSRRINRKIYDYAMIARGKCRIEHKDKSDNMDTGKREGITRRNDRARTIGGGNLEKEQTLLTTTSLNSKVMSSELTVNSRSVKFENDIIGNESRQKGMTGHSFKFNDCVKKIMEAERTFGMKPFSLPENYRHSVKQLRVALEKELLSLSLAEHSTLECLNEALKYAKIAHPKSFKNFFGFLNLDVTRVTNDLKDSAQKQRKSEESFNPLLNGMDCAHVTEKVDKARSTWKREISFDNNKGARSSAIQSSSSLVFESSTNNLDNKRILAYNGATDLDIPKNHVKRKKIATEPTESKKSNKCIGRYCVGKAYLSRSKKQSVSKKSNQCSSSAKKVIENSRLNGLSSCEPPKHSRLFGHPPTKFNLPRYAKARVT